MATRLAYGRSTLYADILEPLASNRRSRGVEVIGTGFDPPRPGHETVMDEARNRTHDPHRFTRDADGSTRPRIRFSKEEADAYENAAGSTPVLDWIHQTLQAAARPKD